MPSDPASLGVELWVRRARRAAADAHRVLSVHESSSSRVVVLEQLVAKLQVLPVDVQDYFHEATLCLGRSLLRAAVVLSWAGFFHVLVDGLYQHKEKEIRQARKKWVFQDLPELKESYAESQILDVARQVGYITKTELRIFQGQLATRNQCAHPTFYRPSLNGALGYVDELVRQTQKYI